jgi:hypothetical protein
MEFEEWKTCTAPRIQGSWNLHTMLPSNMDFFLLLSSICGVVGFAGQANYAASNTYMDALARYRSENSQKAISLDLGWMESIGTLHESEFLRQQLETAGHAVPIPQSYFLAILDKYCDPDLQVGTNVHVAFGLRMPSDLRAQNKEALPWMARNTFNHLDQHDSQDASLVEVQTSITDYHALFQAAETQSDAVQIVQHGLVKKISLAISKPMENIDTSRPLYEYGVDSLLALELRNWFLRELKADIAVFDIIGSTDFASLCDLAVTRSLYKLSSWADEIE